MSCEVRVLADSRAPSGRRLITCLATYWRAIHAELKTHRELSTNSASSRAIPLERMLRQIRDNPFVPEHIGKNQRGMQAKEQLDDETRALAEQAWLAASASSVHHAEYLASLGVHKQVVNRLTEPSMRITTIISSTEWANWDGLRDHEAAEPHMQDLARALKAARDASTPRVLAEGEWHTPLFPIDGEDVDGPGMLQALADNPELSYQEIAKRVSVGRCARVSYLTHDGRRDLGKDLELYDLLMVQRPLHASPAEHVAQAMGWPAWWSKGALLVQAVHGVDPYSIDELLGLHDAFRQAQALREEHWYAYQSLCTLLSEMRSGNFYGWTQYRKTLPFEHITGRRP